MDWKLRAEGATAEETAGVMKSFCVFWPEIFLPNICHRTKQSQLPMCPTRGAQRAIL
jgi:hypothetical protein